MLLATLGVAAAGGDSLVRALWPAAAIGVIVLPEEAALTLAGWVWLMPRR